MKLTDIDPEYEETKRLVDKKWGKRCIFDKCLSITEAKMLTDGSPKCVDRCHVLSRSDYPNFKYNPNNIVPLKRFIHQRMDSFQSPLSGEFLDENEHYFWWARILQKKIIKYDSSVDYKEEVFKILKII